MGVGKPPSHVGVVAKSLSRTVVAKKESRQHVATVREKAPFQVKMLADTVHLFLPPRVRGLASGMSGAGIAT